MNKSWLGLGLSFIALLLVVGCAAEKTEKPAATAAVTQEEAAPPPPPPPPPPPEEAPPPVAEEELPEWVEPPGWFEEYDVEPFYEVPPETRGLNANMLPADRGAQPPDPSDYRQGLAEEPSKEPIYDAARRFEEDLAQVAAAPQPPGMGSPLFKPVYFDFDRSNIKPEFRDVIDENANTLKANPNMSVVIEGHCDERGTTEYNLALGNRRANAVQEALVSQGVDPNQLGTVSYGEERPVAFGHDEESWAQNRRSVISIR